LKTLIIAEKPDMGRNIGAAIEPKAQNKRTYLEGETYIITWAIGHLIGLAEPDKYDDKYKRWNYGDLPILPDSFKLIPQSRTKDQLKVIAELAKRCDRLVNACDAGREGQLIFSYIQQFLKLRQPVKRLWISDLTVETIRRGFAQLKEGAEYDNLTKAARSRSEADWLIGMNGSRAFTIKHRELLSVGRVQTPLLALIYDRHKQIEAFSSAMFYEIDGWFAQGGVRYKGRWQGERLEAKEKAEQLAAKVQGKPGVIAQYDVKDTLEHPGKLYDLTLLQREANARYGFSAKKTLDLAQTLYEKHKTISYPRTNSNYVNEQNVPEMRKSLEMLKGTTYAALAVGAESGRVHVGNKFVCNPAMVEDHHAILPTAKKPGAMSPEESKIYDLIVRRFLAHYYPPAEYKVHTVLTVVEEETFKTTVKERMQLGWKVVYAGMEATAAKPKRGKNAAADDGGGVDSGDSGGNAGSGADSGAEEVELEFDGRGFALDADTGVMCEKAEAVEKQTQPPKQYTEGTLLRAMESAGKQIEDEQLREAMKDAGLGTPATRAATIERLKQVGYIVLRGKQIRIERKGIAAVELIRGAGVELLTSPEMTGAWERRLNEIAKGKASDVQFMENVRKFARLIVDKVAGQARADRQAFGAAEAGAAPGGAGAAGATRGRAAGGKRAGVASAKPRGTQAAIAESAAQAVAPDHADGLRRAAAAATPRRERPAQVQATAAAPAPMEAQVSAALPKPAPSRKAAAPAQAAPTAAPVQTSPTSAALPSAPTQAPPSAGNEVAPCPRPGCGGHLFMGRKGYGCSNYKSGCRFVIWKDSFGHSLTDAMIRSLATKGRTAALQLADESGRPYKGRLVLEDSTTGRLSVERTT
jgi:DNA topoisomerase-3